MKPSILHLYPLTHARRALALMGSVFFFLVHPMELHAADPGEPTDPAILDPDAGPSSSQLESEGTRTWLRGFGQPDIDGGVADMIEYQGNVVIGGSFISIGDNWIRGIAMWDGEEFLPLGEREGANVRDLEIWNGSLIAVGNWPNDTVDRGSEAALRWDGDEWVSLGLSGDAFCCIGRGDELIVAGSLYLNGSQTTMAVWDGSEWSAWPDPPPHRYGYTIEALTFFEDDLFAAGSFDTNDDPPLEGIARWNGSHWEPVGDGLTGDVFSLAVYDDQLVAAGTISSSGSTPLRNVVTWDGKSWADLGWGADGTVLRVQNHEDQLLCLGSFSTVAKEAADGIAAWDGSSWSTFGDGLDDGAVLGAVEFEGEWVVSGSFSRSGGNYVAGFARFDGSSWKPVLSGLGLSSNAHALVEYDGKLVAGGSFTRAGTLSVNYLAAFDGHAWQTIGPSIESDFGGGVTALEVFRGDLIVAGNFERAGGEIVENIARWDGTDWWPMGEGVDGPVYSLHVYDNQLYVGGAFDEAGGDGRCGLARWDGRQWQSAGIPACDFHDFTQVWDMTTFEGDLIIGGSIGTIHAKSTPGIARWDGNGWNAFGRGAYGMVRNLEVHDGELYAGGGFVFGGGIPVRHVMRWDGTRWQWLDHGLADARHWGTRTEALKSFDGGLYVAGVFERAGSVETEAIARWEDSEWHEVDGGIRGWAGAIVWDMETYQGRLYVAGKLLSGGNVASGNLAVWGEPFEQADFAAEASERVVQIAANPTRGRVDLSLHLNEPAPIRVVAFDASGRELGTLFDGTHPAGDHVLKLDFEALGLSSLSSGIYWLRTEMGDRTESTKIVLVR